MRAIHLSQRALAAAIRTSSMELERRIGILESRAGEIESRLDRPKAGS